MCNNSNIGPQNCIKKPHLRQMHTRMRRLCPPCQRDPALLPVPVPTASTGACACPTDAWFCPPCIKKLVAEDTAYRIECENSAAAPGTCWDTVGCARGRHDCVGLLDDEPVIEQDDGSGWAALAAALEQQGDEQLEDCAFDAELWLLLPASVARHRHPPDRCKWLAGKSVAFDANDWALPDEVNIPPPVSGPGSRAKGGRRPAKHERAVGWPGARTLQLVRPGGAVARRPQRHGPPARKRVGIQGFFWFCAVFQPDARILPPYE